MEKFEEYTIKYEDGVQFIYFKGEKLPNLVNTSVSQKLRGETENGKKLVEINMTVLALIT